LRHDPGLQCDGSVGLILAHVAEILLDILECESDLPLSKTLQHGGKEEAEESKSGRHFVCQDSAKAICFAQKANLTADEHA
jgi:hypothetical protein